MLLFVNTITEILLTTTAILLTMTAISLTMTAILLTMTAISLTMTAILLTMTAISLTMTAILLTMMVIQMIIYSFQKCGSLSGKRGTYKRDTDHIMKKREDIITCEDCCNDSDFCNIDGCGETGKYTYDLSTLTCSPVDICSIDIFLT